MGPTGIRLGLGVGSEPVPESVHLYVSVFESACLSLRVCVCVRARHVRPWQGEGVRKALDSRFPKRKWFTAQVSKFLGPEARQGLADHL